MRSSCYPVLCCLGLAAFFVFSLKAEEAQPLWLEVNPDDVQTRRAEIGHDFYADYSFVAGSTTKQGDARFGDLEEHQNSLSYVASIPTTDSIHTRLGLRWDRFSFGVPDGAILPNTLQSTALSLGVDAELGENWLLRVEVAPGIYSDFADSISGDDFSMPVIVGFSYLVDSKLQWVFGLQANWRSDIPVLPGAGVRWQFAEDWTLNAIFPKPRLEYRVDDSLTLHVGADLRGGTYVVRDDFGDSFGEPRLNSAAVDYSEARVNFGVQYRIHPAVNLVFEGGYVFFRRFDFHDEDLTIRTDPTPYGSIGLQAKF
jgi:hypothetical protein